MSAKTLSSRDRSSRGLMSTEALFTWKLCCCTFRQKLPHDSLARDLDMRLSCIQERTIEQLALCRSYRLATRRGLWLRSITKGLGRCPISVHPTCLGQRRAQSQDLMASCTYWFSLALCALLGASRCSAATPQNTDHVSSQLRLPSNGKPLSRRVAALQTS